MVERTFSSKKPSKKPQHAPHGLSREAGSSGALPMILGLVCAVVVLAILWVAYTYI